MRQLGVPLLAPFALCVAPARDDDPAQKPRWPLNNDPGVPGGRQIFFGNAARGEIRRQKGKLPAYAQPSVLVWGQHGYVDERRIGMDRGGVLAPPVIPAGWGGSGMACRWRRTAA